MRYLIAGTGAAGLTAAETIRQNDPHSEILMFTNEADGYYSRPGLAYYLTGEIPEKQLYPYNGGDFTRQNFKVWQAEVKEILPDSHMVILENNTSVRYDHLLIATGSSAVQPNIPGIDLHGVVKLDNLQDARQILRNIRKTRSAVIVGGGITALEIVEGLQARKIKTNFFLRKNHYWSNVLDESKSQIVLDRLVHEGVTLHRNTELDEIIGKNGKVIGVRTKNGDTIRCEMVAVAIGVRPNLMLAKGSEIKIDRGILVNHKMETNMPDVYAAGDVAQFVDQSTGNTYMDVLWGVARNQGRVAGINMTGGYASYERLLPYNVTRLAGLTTTIIGMVGNNKEFDEDLVSISRGDSETFREIPDAIIAQNDFDVNRIRLIIGDSTLLGAIVMGDQTLSMPVQKMIMDQLDIRSIKNLLMRENADIHGILEGFWKQYREHRGAQ